jgi:uncharacterized protein involved in exopolysaccharide biosynthesis
LNVEIEELRTDIEASEANSYQRTGAGRGEVDARDVTNPAYMTLQSELDVINMRLNALENDNRRLLREEESIYAKLRTMPDVEKQYNDLLLDRENAKGYLNELRQKLEVARLSEGMEEGQLGEKFAIAEPAFLPEEPYKPNRFAIMLIGLALGLGAGVGMGALKEYTDHAIHTPEEIERLTGLDVVSVIPYVEDLGEKKRAKFVSIWSGAVIILGSGIALFHYQVMDLYIFYDKVSKFLGDHLFVYF